MKEVLQNWIDGNLPLPGVAACCAQLADRTYVRRCYGDGFVTAQVERVLNRLAMAADNLGKHGLEVARRLRAHPSSASIRIVALSAHLGDAMEAGMLEAGFTGSIAKPIRLADFPDQIRSYLAVAESTP